MDRMNEIEGAKTRFLRPDQLIPLVIEPTEDCPNVIEWTRRNTNFIEDQLLGCGAILFRGFEIGSVLMFEKVIKTIAPQLVDYIEGSSSRIKIHNKIYTSTEYPAEYSISMHNELSYAKKWPSKLFFYCHQPALEGGETPLADCRKIYEMMDPRIKEE